MELNEVWKDIPEYEGFYQVSNLGRVKSVERYVNHKNGKALRKSKILKPETDVKGYYRVRLSINQNHKRMFVHRIVAMTFLNPILHADQVNHKNERKNDNRLANLEWVSRRENQSYRFRKRKLPIGIYDNGQNFIVRVSVNKKRITIGSYKDVETAAEEYKKALIKLNITNKYSQK